VSSAWLEEFPLSKDNLEIVAALIAVKIASTFLGKIYFQFSERLTIFYYFYFDRPKETVHLHPFPLSDRSDVSQVQHHGRIARSAGNAEARSGVNGQCCMGNTRFC